MSTVILIALIVGSLLISILTSLKVKGKTIFKIIFSIFRGVVFFFLFYLPLIEQPRILDSLIVKIIAGMILVFGILLSSIGSKQLMQTDLNGIKGIPDKIIKNGLYRKIRHPINLGLLCVFSGWYLIFPGLYAICFLILLISLLIVETFWEEKNLIKKFGNEYIEYKKNVGMFFPKSKVNH